MAVQSGSKLGKATGLMSKGKIQQKEMKREMLKKHVVVTKLSAKVEKEKTKLAKMGRELD